MKNKKTLVRIVAALLVAMLALTLIPMGAFAKEAVTKEEISVVHTVFDKQNPTWEDVPTFPLGDETHYEGDTIKINTFDKYYYDGANLYDFRGFIDFSNSASAKKPVAFNKKDLTVPAFPVDGTPLEQDEWRSEWKYIYAGYTLHNHKLSVWYSDGTTHWRECLVCKKLANLGLWEQFMYQNWCQDGDEDGICNVCGGDVPYHDITVVESEGGKITLNRDNASHRTKITADVEVADGYKLKALHFVKVRDDGSKQEITRHKENGQFWTLMPTYEMEVSAEFIKK